MGNSSKHNKAIAEFSPDPLQFNATHDGAWSIQFKRDIPIYIIQIIVESNERKFIDHRVNICQWYENRRGNFLINIFKNYYEKNYNMDLFKCPIKKGVYHVAGVRLRPTNTDGLLPGIVLQKGIFNVTFNGRTIINKNSVGLFQTFETYEFY